MTRALETQKVVACVFEKKTVDVKNVINKKRTDSDR